jgi:hypothetical protein
LLLGGFAVAGLLVGSAVLASNFGFKLVYDLTHTGGLPANDFSVGPAFNSPFVNAQDIYQAAPGAAFVARLNASSNTFTIWFPIAGNAANNFSVAKGEGYLIRIPSGVSTSITLVGSHDPSFTYNFNIAGRDFLVAIPYHTTWQFAQDVFKAVPNASAITKLNPATNTFTIWTPLPGNSANNFGIVIGEAYRVRVSSAPSVAVPEHF